MPVDKVKDEPLSETYRRYLRAKTEQLAGLCKASAVAPTRSGPGRNLALGNSAGGDLSPS